MHRLLVGAVFLVPLVSATRSSLFQRNDVVYSKNVSRCPGYMLGSLTELDYGFAAQLHLTGLPCNAFGSDIADLTLEVIYQSMSTVHVKMYDTAQRQFVIPESVIERPSPPTTPWVDKSDLVFNYESRPFAFWITRRSEPDGMPIFDTRVSSLPPTPIPAYNASDPSTAFDGFPLVFEDQYLQITSALPFDANIYGLGEVLASSGFRRDIGTGGGTGTIQTHWNRDAMDPIDQNIYGSHKIYLEHRYNQTSGKASASGVLLLSAAGSDIILQTPVDSDVSLIEYRMLGGIFDFYFFSGPTDAEVIAQYGATIGYPMMPPAWAFGFHLCRWGYHSVEDDIANVEAMRAADIPLEVQWNDIDLLNTFRDFTTDPVHFSADSIRKFTQGLAANHQHYIPIVDAAIALTVNASDVYNPFTRGVELDTFVKNPDGSLYVGQVWPGYTAFPDWFAENAESWWAEALLNWSLDGVEFSGIWLDMNEASSFCDGSCGTGANLSALAPLSLSNQFAIGYPECYDETRWGPSGNMTINGTSTFSCTGNSSVIGVRELTRLGMETRSGIGAAGEPGIDVSDPPYAIHNAFGPLLTHTLAPNATHQGGYIEFDVHNLYGMIEARSTYSALKSLKPGLRPFIIGRSTFPSAGRWEGHWLGDNYSKWEYMYMSIQGMLQFQIYQIPMVGADTCGFLGNTDEELCNRWMQLSAFMPFYRNHNTYGALPQEPYRWDSVAIASRVAITARYSLLPYWYTLFWNASTNGLPPVRALFFEFPHEPELFTVDGQWLIGSDILVTPVLDPGATTVDGILPGRGNVIWRDWWTHAVVSANSGAPTTLSAPIGHINVHVRDGAVLLLHAEPAYTIFETRNGSYALMIALDDTGSAWGHAYVDDGESDPPGPGLELVFVVGDGALSITGQGTYVVEQLLETVTVLGVGKPTRVMLEGKDVGWTYDAATEELVVSTLEVDLNKNVRLTWE